MKLVYICSRYRADVTHTVEEAVDSALYACSVAISKGYAPIAPHLYLPRCLDDNEPAECARLQGFPDWWADLPQLEDMTDEAFSFWQEVRATYAAINGKTYKPVSKRQMVKWYNKLHTDSAEYKMWGNGVALPVVRIPLHGMAQLGAKTMGSLFDGSGGFPLAGLLDGIETLWASEIEPYPIAVTAWNFGGRAQVLLGGVHRNE